MALVYVFSVPHAWQCEGVDEIEYLSLAHSMLRGFGYTIYGEPHVLYPPLYATMLSVIMRLIDVHAWRVMYAVNALLGIGGWIIIGSWMRSRFGAAGRWAAWFLLFSYYAWSFPCRFLMTEPVFLPISFMAILLAWRILERNEGLMWEYLLLALLCLLGAMTRAAAVSLNLALVAAGGWRWLTTRRRAGLGVAVVALLLGVGFFAYWSIRADIVNPNAAESHWRWAKKYLGMSAETEGIIARGEEVTEVSAVLHRRLIFAAMRYGQFVLSVVRPPQAFLPLALLLAIVFLVGFAVHWRRHGWSPPAWYTLVFLGMILNTTWLSNYLRFYVVLAPFLFLFLAEGVSWVWAQAVERRSEFLLLTLAGWSAWGLFVSVTHSGGIGGTAAEANYLGAIRVAVSVFWFVVLFATALAFLRPIRISLPVVEVVLPAIFVLTALQAGALIMLRARRGAENETPQLRQLYGSIHCAAWVRENTPEGVTGVAAIPRLASFTSARRFVAPTYRDDGRLDLSGVQVVLLTGRLVEVAPYRHADELRLAAAVSAAVAEGRLIPARARGGAAAFVLEGLLKGDQPVR